MSVAQSVEKIRSFYEHDLPTRIPFDKHPLQQANDYVKELYCTMLAVILQYEHNPLREQTIFLERIASGINLESSVQQLMQKAQTVDEKFAKDFYDEMVDSEYIENFIVDALMMINCTVKAKENQLSLLTELIDVLAITEQQLKELLKLANIFLALNGEAFQQLIVEHAKVSCLNKFSYYTKLLFEKLNSVTKFEGESLLIYYNACITPDFLGQNMVGKSLVIFKQCTFSKLQNTISIENVGNVIFDECTFENCSKNIISCNSVQNICVYKSTVSNVHYKGSDDIYGAFLKINGHSNLFMYNSVFNDVTVHATHSSPYSSAPIVEGEIVDYNISNNLFNRCKANGTYRGREGALIVIYNNSSTSIPDRKIHIAGEPTFAEFLKAEYTIEVKNKVINNNQLIDCQPNELFNEYEY